MSQRLVQTSCILAVLSMIMTVTSSFAFVGGRAAPPALASTVRLGPIGASCTGVVVASRFVVTAAHCNLKGNLNAGLSVSITSALQLPNQITATREILNFHQHPAFRQRMQGGEVADIAILEFEDLSDFHSAVISPISARDQETVLIGGYGRTQTLRVAPKVIRPEEEGLLTLLAAPLVDADGKNQSIGGVGDSGGPAYRWNSSRARFEVIGLNHAITQDNPRTLIMRIAPDLERDPYQIGRWIQTILPSEAFAD